jgi:DNA-directed RNA polymerase subunit F
MNKKVKDVLHSVQTISALANCIIIEHQNDLIDSRFKIPVLNQKAKRIREYSEDIKKAFAAFTVIKDEEYMEYEHSSAMHRLFKWFALLDAEQINSYMDELENLDKKSTEIINKSAEIIFE